MYFLRNELDRGSIAAFLALLLREDLGQAASFIVGGDLGTYLLHWGWVLHRLGNPSQGLELIEQALEIGQGQDDYLMLAALTNIAEVYQAIGQPQQALSLYQQALPIWREVGDRA
jgi:tetratricopeptide (TPR) repeat protein